MMRLLRRYVRQVIKESNVLMDEDETTDDDSEMSEFSGVGAIAGFTAPLGMSGSDLESPNVKERKKRKKPTWK